MDCKTSFIVDVTLMEEDEVFDFIDLIGIEAGVTDDRLYFGLKKCETDDNFLLSEFIRESLSSIIHKIDILKELKKKYRCNYILNVKFSDIEEEINNKQSFILDDDIINFIKETDTYYNLNDGYFED